MRTTRTVLLPLSALLMALVATGCSGGGESGSGDGAGQAASYDCDNPDAGDSPTSVSIAALPIVSNGALYAGVEQGYFTDNGLELEIQPVASVAAGLSAVQGGTSDFAFAPTVQLFQAISNGVPLSIAAPFAGIAPGYYDKMKAGDPDYQREISALVAKDSAITRPRDLNGKTVAVVDVQGQSELTVRFVIDEDGGDSSTVKFTNLPLPDAANALEAGQVDAAFSVDPFLTKLESGGARVISWPGVETFHEGPTSVIAVSNEYLSENREVVARFTCAMRQSTQFANENHDEIRNVTAESQGVDPATLASAVVPYFYDYADLEGLNRFKSVMLDYEYLGQDFAVEDVVVPEAVRPDDADENN